jgi:hypothetical protein
VSVLRNPKHETFAQQFAKNGNATQAYIDAGYPEQAARQCASRLLTKANVRARVTELQELFASRVIKREIADRNSRVASLQDIWDRMHRVVEARAADESLRVAPGGDTGLLVRQLKKIGTGRDAEIVEEFAVDTGLLKEMRAHAQQAAQELGQWDAGKGDIDPKEAPPFVVEVTPDAPDGPAE